MCWPLLFMLALNMQQGLTTIAQMLQHLRICVASQAQLLQHTSQTLHSHGFTTPPCHPPPSSRAGAQTQAPRGVLPSPLLVSTTRPAMCRHHQQLLHLYQPRLDLCPLRLVLTLPRRWRGCSTRQLLGTITHSSCSKRHSISRSIRQMGCLSSSSSSSSSALLRGLM
jgi:hypothetical protein